MDDWAESDLAWELAEVISPLLTDSDRTQLYATLGSGNAYTAITMLLQTSARDRHPLPLPLVNRLGGWLDGYAHSDEAPVLRELLTAIAMQR